jgi:hypothetical protein
MSVKITFVVVGMIAASQAQSADTEKPAFREIYREMVEIDSSATTGSCTNVVRAAESRLAAAGFAAGDMQVVIPDGKPDDAAQPTTRRWPQYFST